MPEQQRVAAGSFSAVNGTNYLVAVDLESEKPSDSAGANIFLGFRLQCTAPNGNPVGSAGGTENLLTGEPVQLSNQLLVTATSSGVHACDVLVNAPNDSGASAGTAFPVTVSWRVIAVSGVAVQTPAVERLPMTVGPNERHMLFSEVVGLEGIERSELQMYASLNLTTCTGIGGSREDGRTWCTYSDVDRDGSTLIVESRFDMVDSTGAVCGAIDVNRTTHEISHYRHHVLTPVEHRVAVPAETCGSQVRVSVLVANEGPASLVAHRGNSSMVTVTPESES